MNSVLNFYGNFFCCVNRRWETEVYVEKFDQHKESKIVCTNFSVTRVTVFSLIHFYCIIKRWV